MIYMVTIKKKQKTLISFLSLSFLRAAVLMPRFSFRVYLRLQSKVKKVGSLSVSFYVISLDSPSRGGNRRQNRSFAYPKRLVWLE